MSTNAYLVCNINTLPRLWETRNEQINPKDATLAIPKVYLIEADVHIHMSALIDLR